MINADGNKGMQRGIKKSDEGEPTAIPPVLGETWEEEFEDTMGDLGVYDGGLFLSNHELYLLFQKYLDIEDLTLIGTKSKKVRIKARKGKIMIEKVEE